MLSSKKMFWLLLVAVAAVSLYPFKSTVVPAWKVRVLDEERRPVKKIGVNYHWRHYSVELEDHEESAYTDEDGYISFPERTVRASILQRILVPLWNILSSGMHASFGPSGYIVVWGRPEEFKTQVATYNKQIPLPETLVLSRVK